MQQQSRLASYFFINRWVAIVITLIVLTFSGIKLSNAIPLNHDVFNVTQQQLTAEHWLDKQTQQNVIMNATAIRKFNQHLVTHNPHVVDPLAHEQILSKQALLAKIASISKQPSSARFYENGEQLTADDFKRYMKQTNQHSVNNVNSVQFALVVNRTALRTFPTNDRVFNKAMDTDLDRFQETGVFPGQALAVLHQSENKAWYLVQSYHYLAWVPAKDIAIGSLDVISQYVNSDQFLMVTGDKVFTNYNPEFPQLSEKQLDMGVKLPLSVAVKPTTQLYGQNPYASYMVELPYRNNDGSLLIKPALIARNQDVHLGYLQYTEQNLIKQAYKFLGERYGWGHDFNARDCTGFIGEIYKTFGILMPRNSGQQGGSQYGQSINFDKNASQQTKLATLNQLKVGDLIYIPGHVMMYIGHDDKQPYVIHDVKGLAYLNKSGALYKGTLSGVSVTPLLPLMLNAKRSYVDTIYNIKSIR